MKNILIDSDVLLDFFFNRIPYADDSALIISLCEENRAHGFLTPVICSNLYYLLRKTASHAKVIQKLTQLLSILDVIQMNKEVVLEALNSEFKDFEDALQHFAAVKHTHVDIIVTRNVKDYKKSEIPVLTPNNYIKLVSSSKD